MLVSPIEVYLLKLFAAENFGYVFLYSCFNIQIESNSFLQKVKTIFHIV